MKEETQAHPESYPHDADKYQDFTRTTARYPGARENTLNAILYCALGLAGEAGEVANKVKKILRDDQGILTAERRAELTAELGDVAWYLARLADEMSVSLSSVLAENQAKLTKRKAEGKIGGSGDNR